MGEAPAEQVVRLRLLMLQNGVFLKASPRCGKCICYAATSPKVTDEGAKPYGTRN